MGVDGPIFGAGIVRKGRLRIVRSDVFAAQLSELRDGPVELRVSRQRATRSTSANARYWVGIVAPIAEHTGYSPEEIHEILKAKFLPKRLAVQDGNGEIRGEFVIGGTTTTLTPADFSEYCDRAERWAAEDLGVRFPSGAIYG